MGIKYIAYFRFISTVTSWGKDRESEACRSLLENFKFGPVSGVSDSYDLYGCCREIWGSQLKELILKRTEANAPFLVRPDSGDPPEVVIKARIYLNFFSTM